MSKAPARTLTDAAEDLQCVGGVLDNLAGLFSAISAAAKELPQSQQSIQIERLTSLGQMVACDWANSADSMRANYVHASKGGDGNG